MTPRTPGFDGRQPAAVDNALAVLQVVAAARPGITAREIHQQLSMPRATVYRILQHLVAEEYLVRSPDLRGFALGSRMQEFFLAAARHLEEPAASRAAEVGPEPAQEMA